jgi:TonB family protein
MSATIAASPLPDAPYRGIQPFRFIDQQIFAAREEETWELWSNMTLYRAVLLYGDSGTGKSSLINAGLLPKAIPENFVVDRLRVQPTAGREIKVERIRSDEIDGYLPSSFAPTDGPHHDESVELSLEEFRTRLEKFRLAKHRPQSNELFHANDGAPRPLLIFDQFEEFVTLFEEAQRSDGTGDDNHGRANVPRIQQKILHELVSLIQDDTLPVKLVFSFREDYLAKLSLLFDHCPQLLDQAQRLLPPKVEALPKIIRVPFEDPELRSHFLKHDGETGSELSDELAEHIATELGRRTEGDTVNLTELQIVCQRLWQSSNPETLFREKGIQGLLKDYGAEVFRQLPRELREPAVALLSRMLTASNTRNIVSENDLIDRTSQEEEIDRDRLRKALHQLSSGQIVRREPRRQIYFYEITSEYLVPWIKERVVERDAAQLRMQAEKAELELGVQRRRSVLLMRLLVAMIVLGVGVIALGIFAYRQYQRARQAELQANTILNALNLANNPNEEEALKGVEQVSDLIKQDKIPSDLKLTLLGPAQSNPNSKVREAALKVLVDASRNDKSVAQSVVAATELSKASTQNLSEGERYQLQQLQVAALPPRFYIHIGDDSQRGQAQQLAALLKKQGFAAPGIEKVGDKGIRYNQLRYFLEPEPGTPTPQQLVEILNTYKFGQWRVLYIRGYENSPKIRPNHYELWLAYPASTAPGTPEVAEIPDRVEQGPPPASNTRPISGGVLNGKAISLPRPAYPAIAKAANAGGAVQVQVIVDENGNVTSAQVVSGHPLLQNAALQAARNAKFSPAKLSGQPVKVTGVIIYNFTPR